MSNADEYSKHLRPRKDPIHYERLPVNSDPIRNGLDPGIYLCEGCRRMIPNNDVFRYFGKLIHEVYGEFCEPEVCGEVSDEKRGELG